MRKDTKKETPKIYKGPDYAENELGIEVPVPGSPEYYSVGDIAAEVKKILGDFGFRLADLLQRGIGEKKSLSFIWGNKNLYRYFGKGEKRINMPNELLLELPLYMAELGKELPASQKESYMYRANELTETIKRYCLENGIFRDTVEEYLKKQSADKLLRFLKSVYVLELPEDTWCYWLCYSTLNCETQQEAKCTLSGCTGLLPHYNKLFSLYFYYRERDIAFQHLLLTATEKYKDEQRLSEALIEIALDCFKQFSDKAALFRRVKDFMEFDITIEPEDWKILITHAYLCKGELVGKAEDCVLAAMKDGKNLHTDCKIEVAEYFRKRFIQEKEMLEEFALEQYLSEDETQ
mgnify:CR=1 FL=1